MQLKLKLAEAENEKLKLDNVKSQLAADEREKERKHEKEMKQYEMKILELKNDADEKQREADEKQRNADIQKLEMEQKFKKDMLDKNIEHARLEIERMKYESYLKGRTTLTNTKNYIAMPGSQLM